MKIVFALIVFLFTPVSVAIAPEPEPPPYDRGYLKDFAGVFAPSDAERFEKILRVFSQKKFIQVVVVTVNVSYFDAPTMTKWAQSLASAYGIGTNNRYGVLFLVAPGKGATIYGSEELQPLFARAGTATRINDSVNPRLGAGDTRGAIIEGVLAIFDALRPLVPIEKIYSTKMGQLSTEPARFLESAVDDRSGT